MLSESSRYDGECIVLTTNHSKSITVALAFKEIVGAAMVE